MKCNKCEKEMKVDNTKVLASNPPRPCYYCEFCDKETHQATLIGKPIDAAISPTFAGCVNCVAIGLNAGSDLVNQNGVVIIGDNIRSLDRGQDNVLFIGDKVAIGETLFGTPINLKSVVEAIVAKNAAKRGSRG
jgi:hypothetical protein